MNKVKIPERCFVAENAKLIGNVELGENVSIWYNAIVRSEKRINIGRNTNIQDGVVIHSDKSEVLIGENCSVGHGTVIDDSSIGNNCLIGMNSTIFDSTIEDSTIVAAGAVVNRMKTERRVLLAGVPAKIKKKLDEKKLELIKNAYESYLKKIKMK